MAGSTLDAARSLLGARLVRDPVAGPRDGVPAEEARGRRVGRIVELEAYIGEDDLASHARFGPTDRNRVMYGPPGIAYVYLVYGMYDCLNIVTEPAGRAAALLVRAVEPLEGDDAMRAARTRTLAGRRHLDPAALEAQTHRIARLPLSGLARGPGLVAAAFDIDRSVSGVDLLDPDASLRIEAPDPGDRPPDPAWTPRVGIAYAGPPWTEHRWRLVDASSPAVSGRRPRA